MIKNSKKYTILTLIISCIGLMTLTQNVLMAAKENVQGCDYIPTVSIENKTKYKLWLETTSWNLPFGKKWILPGEKLSVNENALNGPGTIYYSDAENPGILLAVPSLQISFSDKASYINSNKDIKVYIKGQLYFPPITAGVCPPHPASKRLGKPSFYTYTITVEERK